MKASQILPGEGHLHHPPSVETPREIADSPELELCWRGLSISISEGYMTRKAAYEMIRRLEEEQEVHHSIQD